MSPRAKEDSMYCYYCVLDLIRIECIVFQMYIYCVHKNNNVLIKMRTTKARTRSVQCNFGERSMLGVKVKLELT